MTFRVKIPSSSMNATGISNCLIHNLSFDTPLYIKKSERLEKLKDWTYRIRRILAISNRLLAIPSSCQNYPLQYILTLFTTVTSVCNRPVDPLVDSFGREYGPST